MSGFFVPHDLKTPLKGAATGPLAGLSVAVKDMPASAPAPATQIGSQRSSRPAATPPLCNVCSMLAPP
jgi:hypothetical protein